MRNQIRVVVVDDNDAVVKGCTHYFSNSEKISVVKTLSSGKEALRYLVDSNNEYDLIVMDVLLPEMDGLHVLEELKKQKIEKKIIITSSFKDDYTIRRAQSLGANYFMLKPVTVSVLEERILDIINHKDEVALAKAGKLELRVSTLLHDLGIPSHIRGYKYIREGILMLYENDDLVTLVTKQIYPNIAIKFETTPSRVERAIRHAIELSWSRGDIKLMEDIFGNSIDFDRSRPTNAEFMTTIADRFKINYEYTA